VSVNYIYGIIFNNITFTVCILYLYGCKQTAFHGRYMLPIVNFNKTLC